MGQIRTVPLAQGLSSPVAHPRMLPLVKVSKSEVSWRGQNFTSTSKHKLRNLGEQRIKACTERGDETEVLLRVAGRGKTAAVSASAMCERGNRLIFGKSGGVATNSVSFPKKGSTCCLSLVTIL